MKKELQDKVWMILPKEFKAEVKKLYECYRESAYTKSETKLLKTLFGYDNLNYDNLAYTLGKQEKDADAVIQGWVARDSNGSLYFYRCKPERVRLNSNDGLWMSETLNELNSDLFPDLTWESDPIEVELIVKRKKK